MPWFINGRIKIRLCRNKYWVLHQIIFQKEKKNQRGHYLRILSRQIFSNAFTFIFYWWYKRTWASLYSSNTKNKIVMASTIWWNYFIKQEFFNAVCTFLSKFTGSSSSFLTKYFIKDSKKFLKDSPGQYSRRE